jgi:hypothetical protein
MKDHIHYTMINTSQDYRIVDENLVFSLLQKVGVFMILAYRNDEI